MGRRHRIRRRPRPGRQSASAPSDGKLVVGGTPYTDQLEDDRAFGQQELKKAGVPIIPQRIPLFDEAIAFVRANPNRSSSSQVVRHRT